MVRIHRALLSVSDKTGLVEFARLLQKLGVTLLSTGGTAKLLRESGVTVTEVSDYTGFPEILDGRVKTLHPRIHGGLLAVRAKPAHLRQIREHSIEPIDMVVVNLYPFRETAARPDATFEDVVEQIDIGGPSMIRSAAKNHASVAVVTDPVDYRWLSEELQTHDGNLSDVTLFLLAQKAFAATAGYDAAIAGFLAERTWSPSGPSKTDATLPAFEVLALQKARDLRYGENPHQRGALYKRVGYPLAGVAGAEILQGKEISYNNLLDSDSAWNLVQEFDLAAAAIIKHTNPCGVAQAYQLKDAYILARDCDPVSAFGSVVAFNRTLDADTAREVAATFVEVVLAPEFSAEALEILKQKKSLRLLQVSAQPGPIVDHRQIAGGFLAQDKDFYRTEARELNVVTRRSPTDHELTALLFGWKVVKHVKSNAIVFCDSSRTLGIGAGQMSRVDSVKWGAQRALLPLQDSAMASDAFFPFPDGIVAAAQHGVRSVIQPGGSVRDPEVIEAADAHDLAMVFTGIRHFKH